MGGKVWSIDEERTFWTRVVPQSVGAAVSIAQPMGWPECAQMMQSLMGDEARRTYTHSMLYEHHYQCVNLATKSPKARAFVEQWKRCRAQHENNNNNNTATGSSSSPISTEEDEDQDSDDQVSLILAHDPTAKRYLQTKGVIRGRAKRAAPVSSSPPTIDSSPPGSSPPSSMFNRDFAPYAGKMMERDAISTSMIQALRPAEAATFARPPQPHAPSGSGQGVQPWQPWSRSGAATSNSLPAHGTDNSPSAEEGSPRPPRPVLPIPNLDRKMRPLVRTPCYVDQSQRESYPSIYPAAGPGTTSAVNTQTLQPLQPVQSQQTLPPLRSLPFIKDLLPPKRPASGHEEESLPKRRYVQQAQDTAQQDHSTQQRPVIIPRSQMLPSGFSTAAAPHGTDSQYHVDPQFSDRDASRVEPRTQYAGQPGWNGQYASAQGHHQTPAYYSYGRGQTATPAPQESYSQGHYRLDATGTPGPVAIPRSEHNGQSQMTYRQDGTGAQTFGSYSAQHDGQQQQHAHHDGYHGQEHSGQQMTYRQDGASAASTYSAHNGQSQTGYQGGTSAPGTYTIAHHPRQPPTNCLEDGTSAAGTYIAPRPASTK